MFIYSIDIKDYFYNIKLIIKFKIISYNIILIIE